MKRIWIIVITALAIIAPVLSIIPATAGESSNIKTAGSNNIFAGLATNILNRSQQSAFNSSYSPMMAHAGEPLTFIIAADDPDGDPLSYAASNLPPGATFDPLTRTFSWTPGYDQAGIYPNIRFEVSDGTLTDSEVITITVENNNRPPTLNTLGNKSTDEQKPMEFTVTAADPDNDVLIYSASNLPAGAAFNPSTRNFSWTPNAGQCGTYSGVRFTASDGNLDDVEDITIAVTTPTTGDVTPPVISGVAAAGITASAAAITWQTNELSNSRVVWYTGSTNATALDTNLVTSHRINITGLQPATVYSYIVLSADAAGNNAYQSGGTFTTSQASTFSVTSLTISPDRVTVGKRVNIRVTVNNRGTGYGTYEVILKINGKIEGTKTVSLAAGSLTWVSFNVVKNTTGTYSVDVNGLTDTFTVTSRRWLW